MPAAVLTTMEDIPNVTKELLFANVPHNICWSLAMRLDPDSTVSGNDWRLMASKFGFDNSQIMHINALQRSHGSNTVKVFEKIWTERQDMTVHNVLVIFREMERVDVFEMLKDATPEIQKQQDKSLELLYNQQAHLPSAQEHTEVCRTCPSDDFVRHPYVGGVPIPLKRKKRSSSPVQSGVISSSVDSDGDVMMDNSGNGVSGMQHNHHQHHLQQQQQQRELDMDIDTAVHDLSSYGDPLLSDCSMHACCNESLPPVESFLSRPENLAMASLESGSILPLEAGLARSANATLLDNVYNEEIAGTSQLDAQDCLLESSKHTQHPRRLASVQLDSTYFHPTSCRRHQVVPNRDVSNGNKLPYTYPRRHKPNKPDLKPIQMSAYRSVSVPTDMQPKEYKTVERKTRVLVTYTDDNEDHLKYMISLANCLKDNQFAVIMDINKRGNDVLYDDMCGKIDKYFEKANYILICISPKYRQEMEEGDNEDEQLLSGSTVCHKLNTRYIYKLMQGEFRNNNSQNKRFIPVLFPKATRHDIPGWLLNTLHYRWPDEWMDLFMFLWRPDREFLDSKISSVKSKYDQEELLQSVPLSPQSRCSSQSSTCSSPGSSGRLPVIKKEST